MMGLMTASARQHVELLDAKHIAIDPQPDANIPEPKQHVGRIRLPRVSSRLLASSRKARLAVLLGNETVATKDGPRACRFTEGGEGRGTQARPVGDSPGVVSGVTFAARRSNYPSTRLQHRIQMLKLDEAGRPSGRDSWRHCEFL